MGNQIVNPFPEGSVYTAARVAEIVRLRRDCYGINAIARQLKADPQRVCQVLIANKLPLKDPRIQNGTRNPHHSRHTPNPNCQLNAPMNTMPTLSDKDRLNIQNLDRIGRKVEKPKKLKVRTGEIWTCLECHRMVPAGELRCREHGGRIALTMGAKQHI